MLSRFPAAQFQAQTLRELAQWTSAARCHLHVLSDAKQDAQPALAEVAGKQGVTVHHLDLSASPAATADAAATQAQQGAQQQQQAPAAAGVAPPASQEEREAAAVRVGLLGALKALKRKRTSTARCMLGARLACLGPLVAAALVASSA